MTTKFMPDLSQQDYALMIDAAIDYRRSHHTVGDAFYNELSDITGKNLSEERSEEPLVGD